MNRRFGVILGLLVSLAATAREPMSLAACIDYALRHSRELGKLELAHSGQEIGTLIRRGKFRPVLTGNLDRDLDADDRTDGSLTLKEELPAGFEVSGTVTGNAASDEVDAASASFRISKVILGGGSYRESMLDINNSLLDELIALNRVRRYRRELVFQVRRTYYRLIRQHLTLRINELRLQRSRTNLEHAIERQHPLDIATARIEVPENEAAVLRAKREIQSTLDELKDLIGMDVREELETETDFQFETTDLAVDSDIAFCYGNHEDILNAGLARRKLDNELPVRKARRWPKLTMSAAASRDSDVGINFDGENDVSLGIALSWELGARTERLRVRELEVDIASQGIEIEDVKQARTRNIRDLARRVAETLQLVKLQERKVSVAELRAELYLDRWQNGEIDILEYIRSQNDLENSRIQLVTLQTTYMELLGEYEFAVGR